MDGDEEPQHTQAGVQRPSCCGDGDLAHAGRNLNIPMAWGQGPGTSAHAQCQSDGDHGAQHTWAWDQGYHGAREWGPQHMQEGTGDPGAMGTAHWGHPGKGFLGQALSTTTHPRGTAPPCHCPLSPSVASKALPRKAKVEEEHFAFARSHQLLLRATSPLNYLP